MHNKKLLHKEFVKSHALVKRSSRKMQSESETFKSALYIAAYSMIEAKLVPALHKYQNTIMLKSKQLSKKIKGRGNESDLPVRLIRNFSFYSMANEISNLKDTAHSLLSLDLNGTKKVNINDQSAFLKELNLYTGYYFTPKEGDSKTNSEKIIHLSASLDLLSSKLKRMSNDFARYNSSGSRLSVANTTSKICTRVKSNDAFISSYARESKSTIEPEVAHNLLESIDLLTKGINKFTEKCISEIRS
ncbi:MAG: lyase family protein [Candidatus Micrarchaeaceae archaeon]|jgi:fumarate hydratase, class II